MPYANSRDVQLHYEVRGHGVPLLLVRGTFANLKWWSSSGYGQTLEATYRLILIDVRGHGMSDKPHDPESYEIDRLVGDLVCVLDALDLKKDDYLGYSMGSWIGLAAAKYAPESFNSFILGEWHPYSDVPGHQPDPLRSFENMVTRASSVGWRRSHC